MSWVSLETMKSANAFAPARIHLGPFGRIDLDDMIDIEENRISLDQDIKVQVLLHCQIGPPVGKGIAFLFGSNIQGLAHSKACLLVPFFSFRLDPGRLPDRLLFCIGP